MCGRRECSAGSLPGPPRKALTVTAAPRTGKGNCGAAPVPAAAPVGGAHRRRAAWDLKGQLSDLRTALGNQKEKAQRLDGENRQLREQLRELQEALRERERRVEELDGRVRSVWGCGGEGERLGVERGCSGYWGRVGPGEGLGCWNHNVMLGRTLLAAR